MMHAYNEIYLERARSVMAHMFDFAVHGLGYQICDFFECFLVSPVCAKFERGDASVIAGKSGVELTYEVIGDSSDIDADIEVDIEVDVDGNVAAEAVLVTMYRSPEFWLGWSLAYYQWYSARRFSEIIQYISIQELLQMYDKYHEMDILHFVERIDEVTHLDRTESRLKKYRKLVGLSQRELAEKTEIPVRTIQQYEQRQKNINKAQVDYVIRLSKSLYCSPEDLLETLGD